MERPVIGRRSSEAQLDCANLLIDQFCSATPLVDDQGLTQLPTSTELIQSVKTFIETGAKSNRSPHEQFLGKVAANALGIVEREITLGPELLAEEQARLRALLSKQGSILELRASLVKRIREGEELDQSLLQAHLLQTAIAQVQIDQPKYSGLRPHLSN